MPLPWTQTSLSLRNPTDLRIHYRHCTKSQQDYIPLSQPSISFRNMKRGQFMTVPTASSATKARQLHCACMAVILCWDSGVWQLIQVCMYSKQSADIPLPGNWSCYGNELTLHLPLDKSKGESDLHLFLIAVTYNLKYSSRPFHPFPLSYSCCGSCHITLILQILIPGTPG